MANSLAAELQDAYYASAVAAARSSLAALPPADIAARNQIVANLDAVAQMVNGRTVPGPDREVPTSELLAALRENQVWYAILGKAKDGGSDAASLACMAAYDLVAELPPPTLNLNDPTVAGMLNALVSGSVMTQAQCDALVAMKNTTLPAYQQFMNRLVDHGDVIVALGHRWEDCSVARS